MINTFNTLILSLIKISNYPNLRGDIENNIISFIHTNAPKYKQNILSLTEMEIAYMNYKHEEFMNNM